MSEHSSLATIADTANNYAKEFNELAAAGNERRRQANLEIEENWREGSIGDSEAKARYLPTVKKARHVNLMGAYIDQ